MDHRFAVKSIPFKGIDFLWSLVLTSFFVNLQPKNVDFGRDRQKSTKRNKETPAVKNWEQQEK